MCSEGWWAWYWKSCRTFAGRPKSRTSRKNITWETWMIKTWQRGMPRNKEIRNGIRIRREKIRTVNKKICRRVKKNLAIEKFLVKKKKNLVEGEIFLHMLGKSQLILWVSLSYKQKIRPLAKKGKSSRNRIVTGFAPFYIQSNIRSC